jgi:hypothetical protein
MLFRRLRGNCGWPLRAVSALRGSRGSRSPFQCLRTEGNCPGKHRACKSIAVLSVEFASVISVPRRVEWAGVFRQGRVYVKGCGKQEDSSGETRFNIRVLGDTLSPVGAKLVPGLMPPYQSLGVSGVTDKLSDTFRSWWHQTDTMLPASRRVRWHRRRGADYHGNRENAVHSMA